MFTHPTASFASASSASSASSTSSGELTADPARLVDAAGQSRNLAHRLYATADPSTPMLSVPGLPEVAEFLSALHSSRSSHCQAARDLGIFFQDASTAMHALNDSIDDQELAAGAQFAAVGGELAR